MSDQYSKALSMLMILMHCFDRDNIYEHRESRPMGDGTYVFITYHIAEMMRDIITETKKQEDKA